MHLDKWCNKNLDIIASKLIYHEFNDYAFKRILLVYFIKLIEN